MIVAPALIDLDFGASDLVRSPGLHMSTVYNDLYQDLDPKRYKRDTPMDMTRIEAGTALESIFEEAIARRLPELLGGGERPGEFMTPEGIAYSPDWIFTDPIFALGEFKVTWMSCREWPISPEQAERWGLESNWDGVEEPVFPKQANKWFTQMLAYCFHLGLNHAVLMAYFVNGDWRPPRPVQLSWAFEFTQRQMEEEWAMIRNHAVSKGML
jgi:hypothetical protein